MIKSKKWYLNRLIFVIMLILSINLSIGTGMILYQKTWSTDRGSELNIDVTPTTASFQPDKIYSYTFILTAVKFGTSVDDFHDIRIYVQFLNAREEISVNDGYYTISSVSSSIQVVLDLIIPSDKIISLDSGESLSGKLQYKVDFRENVAWAIDPSYSTGWETIADGKISVPPDYSALIILGGLGLIVIVSGVVIYSLTRSKKPTIVYGPPVIQAKSQLQADTRFCPHCGKPTESTAFCSSCGGKIS